MDLWCIFPNDTAHSLLHFCDLTFSFPPPVKDEAMGLLKPHAHMGAAFLHVGGSRAGSSGVVGSHGSLALLTFGTQFCRGFYRTFKAVFLLSERQHSPCQRYSASSFSFVLFTHCTNKSFPSNERIPGGSEAEEENLKYHLHFSFF